jgi:hypothetical protein
MDDTLKRLIELGVNATPAIREMEKVAEATARTSQGVADVQKQLEGYADSIKGVFSGLGVGAAIEQAISGIKNMIDSFDQLGKSAQVAGTSVEKLQEMQFALKLGAGLGADEATSALARFSDQIADVNNKTSDAARVMRAMGVAAGDSADTGLRKIADAFAAAPDGVNKTAIAIELFGRNLGMKMIPFLNQGAAGIDAMNAELKKLGGTISGDVADQSGKFNDNLTKIGQNAKGAGQAIVGGLLPYLNDLTGFLVKNIEAGTLWSGMWQRFKDNWKDNDIILKRALTGQNWGPTNLETREQTARLDDYAAKMKGYADQVGRMKSAVDLPPAHIEKIKAAGKAAAAAKSDFEAWMDSMIKIQTATDDSGAKIQWLEKHLAALAKTGDTSSEVFKKWSAELLKLRPDALSSELLKIADAAKKVDEATSDRMLKGLEDQLAEIMKDGPVATAQVKLLHDQILKIKADSGDALAKYTQDLEKSRIETQRNNELWAITEQQFADGAISLEEYSAALTKYLGTMSKHTAQTKDDVTKLSDEIEKMGAKFVTDFIDQMIDGMGKADASFTDMVTSMIKQLAKLIIQMQAAEFFKNSGGWASGLGGLFTTGGSVQSASAPSDDIMTTGGFLARSPVLRADTSSTTTTGGSAPRDHSLAISASPVTVNVHNNTPAEVTTSTRDNADGQRVIDILVTQKVKQMMNDGTMDRTMRSAYGVTRQPAMG